VFLLPTAHFPRYMYLHLLLFKLAWISFGH
jgi:hypothetical protein